MNMNEENNYYNILNVNSNASPEEIKKQFRKLSMKYHPDKNGNSKDSEVIFQKISAAYDTLGDSSKRKEYDLNLKFGSSNPTHDLFNAFFGAENMHNSSTHNMSKMPIPPPFFGMFNMGPVKSNEIPIHMAPSGFLNADMFTEQIEQELKNMFISGSVNNNFKKESETIFKKKEKEIEKNIKPSTIHVTLTIDIVQSYNGCSLPVEIDREIWHDSSIREKEKETIYINVPQGIDDNEVIVVKEKGHINKYNKIGDVKVHIKVDNNTEFIRNGIDLILHKHITLKESLCGFYFEFTHITGKIFRIHNKMGTIIAPEFKKKIDKLGMKRENHIGNLIILFHVKYPENIPIEKLKQIEEILE